MSQFYNGIVKNLKQEAQYLNSKLIRCRETDNMNGYIATLKSLRETLDLIKKYDWTLMFSEYGVEEYDKKSIEKELIKISDEIDICQTMMGEDTLNSLIQQKYELKEKLNSNNLITEIAVWEQNHEGQIRNHKVWRTNISYNMNAMITGDGGIKMNK